VIATLPEPLQKLLIDAIMAAKPERATDIFYEDERSVYVMRQGVQFRLTPPESYIWTELGKGTTSDIIDRVAKRMNIERDRAFDAVAVNFLLGSEHAQIVTLFPPERTQRQTNL
jgi:hypothetical protein